MVSPEPKRRIAASDSWASVQYDDNAGGCMRDIEAYGVQMKDDITWAGSNIYFDFSAGPVQLLGGLRDALEFPSICPVHFVLHGLLERCYNSSTLLGRFGELVCRVCQG